MKMDINSVQMTHSSIKAPTSKTLEEKTNKNIKPTNNFTSIEYQQNASFPISFQIKNKKEPNVLNKIKQKLGGKMPVFKEENEMKVENKQIEPERKSIFFIFF